MMNGAPEVFVVDDDQSVRDAVDWLMGTVGIRTRGFAGAKEFLAACVPEMRGCAIIDLRMPEMGGLELQSELRARNLNLQVIILTAHGDVSAAVRAMKNGAVDFIEKPFSNQLLIDTVQHALSRAAVDGGEVPEERADISDMTPREREVLRLLVSGHTNKEVSRELGISVKTVEYHRANVMRKTDSTSLSDLVRKTAQVTLAT